MIKPIPDLIHYRKSYASIAEIFARQLLWSICRVFDLRDTYNGIEHGLLLLA